MTTKTAPMMSDKRKFFIKKPMHSIWLKTETILNDLSKVNISQSDFYWMLNEQRRDKHMGIWREKCKQNNQ